MGWEYQGLTLVTRGPQLQTWRAPTDNDATAWGSGRAAIRWREAGLHRLQHRTERMTWREAGPQACVLEVDAVYAGYSLAPAFRCAYRYVIYGSGDVVVTARIVPRADLPPLPRLGLRLFMPAGFERFDWYGRGPHESHVDRKHSARVGVYGGTVQEQYVPYVRPQENGNKTDVRWAAVTNARGMGLLAVGLPLMEASAHHYTAEDCTQARHTHELVRRNETILSLDYRQGGLGSNSCGPEPLPQYLLLPEPVTFSVRLAPFCRESADPMALSRRMPEAVDL